MQNVLCCFRAHIAWAFVILVNDSFLFQSLLCCENTIVCAVYGSSASSLTVFMSKNAMLFFLDVLNVLVFWLSSLFLSLCLTFLPLFLLFFPSSWCTCHPIPSASLSPSPWPHGAPRPYGLEEDVRQYEQDLAKRLYQARVRASQGTPEAPQPPSPSSAASQLRSAPRPQPPGPDARHRGGVLGCFGIGVFC